MSTTHSKHAPAKTERITKEDTAPAKADRAAEKKLEADKKAADEKRDRAWDEKAAAVNDKLKDGQSREG